MLRPIDKHKSELKGAEKNNRENKSKKIKINITSYNYRQFLKAMNKRYSKKLLREIYHLMRKEEEFKNFNWKGVMQEMRDISGKNIRALKGKIYGPIKARKKH